MKRNYPVNRSWLAFFFPPPLSNTPFPGRIGNVTLKRKDASDGVLFFIIFLFGLLPFFQLVITE